MPHLIVHASPTLATDLHLDVVELLTKLNLSLWQSGEFAHPADIKSRYVAVDAACIGIADSPEGQQHQMMIELRLLAGRSDVVCNQLATGLLQAAREVINERLQASKNDAVGEAMPAPQMTVQLCVEVQPLSPYYQKTLIDTSVG